MKTQPSREFSGYGNKLRNGSHKVTQFRYIRPFVYTVRQKQIILIYIISLLLAVARNWAFHWLDDWLSLIFEHLGSIEKGEARTGCVGITSWIKRLLNERHHITLPICCVKFYKNKKIEAVNSKVLSKETKVLRYLQRIRGTFDFLLGSKIYEYEYLTIQHLTCKLIPSALELSFVPITVWPLWLE